MSDTKVKVAVRVRPMNRRGEELSARFCPGSGRGRGQLWKLRGREAGRRARSRGRRAGRRRRRGPARAWPPPRRPRAGGMLHFATFAFPCAFRTGTEHQMCGGDGRESNGPAPSSFQHETGRKVTRARRGREEDPTPQSASLSQENGSALFYC